MPRTLLVWRLGWLKVLYLWFADALQSEFLDELRNVEEAATHVSGQRIL